MSGAFWWTNTVITLLDCARKAQRRYAVLLVNVIQCHISGTHSGLIMLHYMFTIFSHSKDLHFYLWTQKHHTRNEKTNRRNLIQLLRMPYPFLIFMFNWQGRASTPMRFSPWNEAADFFGGHQSTAMLLQAVERMIQTNLWSWSLSDIFRGPLGFSPMTRRERRNSEVVSGLWLLSFSGKESTTLHIFLGDLALSCWKNVPKGSSVWDMAAISIQSNTVTHN